MDVDTIVSLVGAATAIVTAVGVWLTAARQKRSAQGFYDMPISARSRSIERHNEIVLFVNDGDDKWILHEVRVRRRLDRRCIARRRDGDIGRDEVGEYVGLMPENWVSIIGYERPIESREFDTVEAVIILKDSVRREIKLMCTLSNNGRFIRKRRYPFVVDVLP